MTRNQGIKLFLIFCLIFFISCAQQQSAYEAGSAKAKDLLNYFPKGVRAIFFIDFHKTMKQDVIDNFLKEEKNKAKFDEFVQSIGINPKEDIYYMAAAITENTDKGKKKGFGIINLKYNKETILKKIKEGGIALGEEDYSGITVYTKEEDDGIQAGAFLDNSNIIIGNEKAVKQVIDSYQKKAENVFKNKELADLIKSSQTKAMVWGVSLFPSDLTKEISSKNAMFKSLEVLEAVTFFFDYKNKNLLMEIRIHSSDSKKNKEIMDVLQGIKAIGSLSSSENQIIGELLSRVEITSGPDYVQIFSDIPKDLVEKIREMRREGKM